MYKLLYLLAFVYVLSVASLSAQINFDDKLLPKEALIPDYIDTAMADGTVSCQVIVDMEDTINHQVSNFIYGNNATMWQFDLFKGVPDDAEIIQNVSDLSPNLLRWPGGSLSNSYFWNGQYPAWMDTSDVVNPWYGRFWELSTDDYYNLLEQTNSTGIIAVNYGYARYGRTADPVATAAKYAADWVRYDNGRTRYWEIGNEHFGSWEVSYEIMTEFNQDGQPRYQTSELYGRHCKVFIDSMKKAAAEIGHEIEIGIVMYEADGGGSSELTRTWNQGVISQVGELADFSSVHNYFGPYGQNSSADVILNTHEQVGEIKNSVVQSYINAGIEPLPTALTEHNIWAVGSSQMVSNVNGIHSTLLLGEIASNDYYLATRWNLNNGYSDGNDHGMFAQSDPDINEDAPYSDFFHMYYFQRYFGDKVVASQVLNAPDVVAFSSAFSSGEAGVVLVNKGDADQLIELDVQNFGAGERYYWHLLEPDGNAEFTKRVLVNGKSAEQGWTGPRNYREVKARSHVQADGKLRIDLPAKAVAYILAEDQGGPRLIDATTGEQAGKLHLGFHTPLALPVSVAGFTVYTGADQSDIITSGEWVAGVPDSLVLILNKDIYPDQPIYLSYDGSSIWSAEGIPMLPFDSVEVTNVLAGSAPEFNQAGSSPDGLWISMEFSKPMLSGGQLSDFFVESGDPLTSRTLKALQSDPENSNNLLLELESPLLAGDAVHLTYSGTSVQSADGGDLKPFGPVAVINHTVIIPALVAASLEDGGYSLELSFSVDLRINGELGNSFKLTQDGLVLPLSFVSLNANILDMSMDETPVKGSELLLSYTGTAIESLEGVALHAFTDFQVSNTLDYTVFELPMQIEAEDFAAESGIYLESCIEGGLNIRSADAGDWMEYVVNVSEAGLYTFHYRYYLVDVPGSFALHTSLQDDQLHLVSPETTWQIQNWDTVIHLSELAVGQQRLRMQFLEPGIHLNWFRIDKGDTRPVGVEGRMGDMDIHLYPNPARDRLTVESRGELMDDLTVVDIAGRILVQEDINSTKAELNLSIPAGYYRLIIRSGKNRVNRSLVIR